MATEIKRRVDFASRSVAVEIEDIFGVITYHSIPMISDSCGYCGKPLDNGSKGTPDIDASIAMAINHVSTIEQDVINKLDGKGFDLSKFKEKMAAGLQDKSGV